MSDIGVDHSWYAPVNPVPHDGYDPDYVLGSYREACQSFNVHNPQPGWHYTWGLLSNRDNMERRRMQGFEIVQHNDPEAAGWHDYQAAHRGTSQGSAFTNGSLVLMRCPIDRIRQLREQRREQIRERIMGPTRAFEADGRAMHEALGSIKPGYASKYGSAYHQGADHGIEIFEGPVQR